MKISLLDGDIDSLVLGIGFMLIRMYIIYACFLKKNDHGLLRMYWMQLVHEQYHLPELLSLHHNHHIPTYHHDQLHSRLYPHPLIRLYTRPMFTLYQMHSIVP